MPFVGLKPDFVRANAKGKPGAGVRRGGAQAIFGRDLCAGDVPRVSCAISRLPFCTIAIIFATTRKKCKHFFAGSPKYNCSFYLPKP